MPVEQQTRMLPVGETEVTHLTLAPGQSTWEEAQPLPTINSILADETIFETPGISLLVFPSDPNDEDDQLLRRISKGNTQIARELSRVFGISPSFFTRSAWDANGTYQSSQNTFRGCRGLENTLSDITSYNTRARFLLKSVDGAEGSIIESVKSGNTSLAYKPASSRLKYHWDYVGLYSLWITGRRQDKTQYSKHIFMCFDVCRDVKEAIVSAFRNANPDDVDESALGCYPILLSALTDLFSAKLWCFRDPVRDFEKHRIRADQNIHVHPSTDQIDFQMTSDELQARERMSLANRYEYMHELQRHVIHAIETLGAAKSTIDAIREDAQMLRQTMGSTISYKFLNTMRTFNSACTDISNLQLRAQAFEKRLQNEIGLAFNSVAAPDSRTARESLSALRLQNSSLGKYVSVLTVLFLSGSFISSFFGTNFFAAVPDQDGSSHFSLVPETWVFFVITVPLTALSLLIYYAHQAGFFKAWSRLEIKHRSKPQEGSEISRFASASSLEKLDSRAHRGSAGT